jgi:hypothetical protein
MYVAQGDMSHQQLDELANEFAHNTLELLVAQIDQLHLPDGVRIELADGSGRGQQPPPGFRSVVSPSSRYIQISFRAPPPGQAELNIVLDIFVSTDSDTATSIMMSATFQSEEILLGLADLSPQLSSAARFRLESYLRRILGEGLKGLLAKSRKRMTRTGY